MHTLVICKMLRHNITKLFARGRQYTTKQKWYETLPQLAKMYDEQRKTSESKLLEASVKWFDDQLEYKPFSKLAKSITLSMQRGERTTYISYGEIPGPLCGADIDRSVFRQKLIEKLNQKYEGHLKFKNGGFDSNLSHYIQVDW